jgi:hypothetical protein
MRVALAIAVCVLCAGALSQEVQKNVPPVSGKAKDAAKRNEDANRKQTISVELPTTTNINVSGKLEVSGGETKKQADTESTKWTDPISLATWLLAVITGGLVIVGYLQIQTSRRQVRAYVSVVSAEIKNVEIGGSPEATVVIRNSGQTPAYGLNGTGGIGMGPSFDTLPPGIGPPEKTVASLAATAFNLQFHKADWILTQDHMTALQNKNLTIWVYGEMSYRDVFHVNRVTKFRFQTGGTAGIQGNRLAACEEGNGET